MLIYYRNWCLLFYYFQVQLKNHLRIKEVKRLPDKILLKYPLRDAI